MPDENGNLIPGDAGYVAPVETPETPPTQLQGVGTVILSNPESPLDELKAVEVQLQEQAAEKPSYAVPNVVEVPIVSQAKYNQLLAAYTKLKQRVGLDIVYEKQLDSEAGL